MKYRPPTRAFVVDVTSYCDFIAL